jgi:carbohydrate-selective porin OprB
MIGFGHRAVFFAAGIAVACAGQDAAAQTVNNSARAGPSEPLVQPPQLAPTQAIDAPPVERLFDDWGGVQPKLQSLGINLQFNAVTEFASNVSGGMREGSTFANQIVSARSWTCSAGLCDR